MADAISTYPNTKQALIANFVQKELQFKSKLLPTITDVSSFAIAGASSISFPRLSSFTAVNRVFGAAGDATALTDAKDQLDLDQNAYVAFIIDASDAMQSTLPAQLENAKRAAAAQARFVESAIVSELDLVAGLNINGGVPADITSANILTMRKYIGENDGDIDNASLVVSWDMEEAMLGLSEFTRADIYGSSNIPNGVIGRVYGIPVLVSNAFSGQQAYMYEKSGCALGFQKRPAMSSQPANEYGVGSERVALDQLFGIKGMQLSEKAAGAGKSPLVCKLAD